MDLEIIYENDTELAEHEAIDKGYRSDIVVKIGDRTYKLYATSPLRLRQDFERELESSGYYLSEPNTILVENPTKEEIEHTVTILYRCKYFERLDNRGF